MDKTHDEKLKDSERRKLLTCMAWAGGGLLWTMKGGVLQAKTLDGLAAPADADFSFIQISDTHVGFHQEANPDVLATLQSAIAHVNGLGRAPAFAIHTGDVSHLSKPEQFDAAQQALKGIKTDNWFFTPGEHDTIGDNGAEFFKRFGGGVSGKGWYSFDYRGMHCICLVNVLNFQNGSLVALGDEQLEWVEDDLDRVSSSTPILVFAHIPLWTVYEPWGWGTSDAPRLYSYLRRFGSVTVLNGHIHQIQQKIEGNMTFYTARGTAYPQPQPGAAPSPGPLKVPAGQLGSYLGIREVTHVNIKGPLAVTDTSLAT
ncbi:MAG TPA: metallophosphoesterase [Gammaproteobacteria bacterium]|jgi:3',5'-cyclic AMP phosphodiesterase CpdA|nr:metallophosphoesterase [Gammaproteobacteria bacterium]